MADAVVPCGRLSGVGLLDEQDTVAVLLEDREGLIGRAVVNDDYFVIGKGLSCEDALERTADRRGTVVYRDYYRDLRRASALLRGWSGRCHMQRLRHPTRPSP